MGRGTAAVRQLEVPQGLKLGASEGPGGQITWKFSADSTSARVDRRAHSGRALDCTKLAMVPSGDLVGTAKEKVIQLTQESRDPVARHMRRRRRRRRKPRIKIKASPCYPRVLEALPDAPGVTTVAHCVCTYRSNGSVP